MKKAVLSLVLAVLLFACSGPVQQYEMNDVVDSNEIMRATTNHDSDILDYYNNWKNLYMKSWGSDNYYVDQSYEILQGWIIAGDSDSDSDAQKAENKKIRESYVSTSEAMGYGLIINAMMAPYADNAQCKKYFDGLYKLTQKLPSTVGGSPLMSWLVPKDTFKNNLVPLLHDTATDGDIDIAYALLIAHKTWGSDGAIDYIAECEKHIKAIAKWDLDTTYNFTRLGDWQANAGDTSRFKYASRPCDWMGGKLGDLLNFFNGKGIDIGYDKNFMVGLEGHIDAATSDLGLAADFVWIDYLNGSTTMEPVPTDGKTFPGKYKADSAADPYFLESEHDTSHYWNSCRFPLRMANWRHYFGGVRTNAPDINKGNLLDWLLPTINYEPDNIVSGYTLSGTPIKMDNGQYEKGSPSFASAMLATAFDSWRSVEDLPRAQEAAWDYWKNPTPGLDLLYFDHSITLLSMFVAENYYREALDREPSRGVAEPWAVGASYTIGDEVSYNGRDWVCSQSHTAHSSAWYPGAPGIWFWNEK